jgi:hypothetical protein
MSPLSLLINFFLGALTIILGIVVYSLRKRVLVKEQSLAHLRKLAKNGITLREYVDVVLIGPRAAGKTCIARGWAEPAARIAELAPSYTWKIFERDVHEFDAKVFDYPELGETLSFKPILTLRIHDYPGEISGRLHAFTDLTRFAKKSVVLFILKVDSFGEELEFCCKENAMYFNAHFTEKLLERIQSISKCFSEALIVFNKVDLLPCDWSKEYALQKLKESNKDAIYQIGRLFGDTECYLTSAASNQGLISLLGDIVRDRVESEDSGNHFVEKISRFQQALSPLPEEGNEQVSKDIDIRRLQTQRDYYASSSRLLLGILVGIIGLILVFVPPLFLSWHWLVTHPNRLGLYGCATLISLAIAWAVIDGKRRNFALGTLVVGAVLVLLQIIGR